ncbi:iron chaperone [Nakamurella sp.]|uniref:iron chaperone n=1 Tax=Nakamurella sp. TaxID=1869182 RepID=UPI003B3B62C5
MAQGEFTAEERAALKERATESRAARSGKKGYDEADLLAKIAEMVDEDREIAEAVHGAVTAAAPDLTPTLWYGMPAYAKDGKVVCFFQPAQKFKARYSTLGFNDPARLDDGAMWPTAFAVTAVTPQVRTRIAALLRQAVS